MSYNGWKNRETWNVALWINNDPSFYSMAKTSRDYTCFVEGMKTCGIGEASNGTPDGVSWTNSKLDTKALDRLIKTLNG